MASTPQQQQAVATFLVEEKHFPIRLERSSHLLREAIEHAIGAPLTELTPGMWTARTGETWGSYEEITVRALSSDDDGTSVEVRLENHTKALAVAVYGTLFIAVAMFVIPLFVMIAMAQKRQKEAARDRMLRMHKIWTELTSSVGAPMRAGYRDRPERLRARVAREESADERHEEEEELEVPAKRAGQRER